ncbi:polyphosphate--glucose phosphotransferase [Arcticibacterium luteifluviistationis]|uniref:Polyphosphate glucokinase n=1 Tax=Arcticibacterium luteifluviistationis TaxID=1784714 RepID=A0A2Z4GC76_9BACT|nr:ROK family protein [Arcticibacterium luteifluviistationis]AWV98668.1 polyphosphate glucokinase [Arcticibacterium luteifluviistationis]
MQLFGIDVGGSGIKGAPVNLETGELMEERFRVETPRPALPGTMALAVKEVLDHFNWKGPVGVGFPTIVANGQCKSQSNLHKDWVNVHIDKLFKEVCGNNFKVINDADAAGLAEMQYGSGKGQKGLVVTVTLGTGIGSGVFYNGQLIPNFELGHLRYKKNTPVEKYAADSVRKNKNLSNDEWAERLNYFFKYVKRVCSPDLIIVGGGASKKWDKLYPHFSDDINLVVAETRNEAGIIGAAMASIGMAKDA